jgi:hypothetical protein
VITYQDDLGLLERTLRSIRPFVDRLIAIDGPFAKFPHDTVQSDNDHLEMLKRFADHVIVTQVPWKTEVCKRNQYLRGKDGDWYLVVDADEELVGNLDLTEYAATDQMGWKMWILQEGVQPRLVLRLFRHFEGIHYEGAHNAICGKDRRPINHSVTQTLSGAHLLHHTWKRPEVRMQAKHVYAAALADDERDFRRRHEL